MVLPPAQPMCEGPALRSNKYDVPQGEAKSASTEPESSPFEQQATEFAKFQHQWANKLSVALTASFKTQSERYRHTLDCFATAEQTHRCCQLYPATAVLKCC